MKVLAVVLVCSASVFASEFLVKKPPVKKELPHQLRTQILERMGSLLEQYASLFEQMARSQQALCKDIKESLEGSKKIAGATSVKELQELLRALEREEVRLENQKKSQEQFLKRFK